MQMPAFLRNGCRLVDKPVLRPVVTAATFVSRLGAGLVEEFRNGLLTLQAMGLVFTTLLSLVPFLAVTFSVLKAFGAQQQLEPFLARMLEPMGEQGNQITLRIVQFVDNLQVGVLGALGVAGLFLTVLSLLGQIEKALNYIWHVRRSRELIRRFSDYFSLILVGPVLVFTALALTASAESHWLLQRVLRIYTLGFIVTVVTRLMPFFFLCVAFTFLYKIIPYTRVQLSSALVGGITAGLLWQLAGAGFTTFVANSSFAVLIIFPLWLYVAWLIVLVGGKVAYLHQHPFTGGTRVSWLEHCYSARAWLALSLLNEITHRHLTAEPPPPVAELSTALNALPAHVEKLVDEFVERGILLRAAEPEGIALGRPPEQIAVSEVLAILDGAESDGSLSVAEPDDPVTHVLVQRRRTLDQTFCHLTLRSLASGTLVQQPDPARLPTTTLDDAVESG
jgi:membrane protein